MEKISIKNDVIDSHANYLFPKRKDNSWERQKRVIKRKFKKYRVPEFLIPNKWEEDKFVNRAANRKEIFRTEEDLKKHNLLGPDRNPEIPIERKFNFVKAINKELYKPSIKNYFMKKIWGRNFTGGYMPFEKFLDETTKHNKKKNPDDVLKGKFTLLRSYRWFKFKTKGLTLAELEERLLPDARIKVTFITSLY